MMVILFTAIFVLFLANFGSPSSEEQYFITPSLSDPCPTDSCLTFDQFATNSTDYLRSNTTLLFLEGTHKLESGFMIKKINVFSMRSSDSSNISIICNGSNSSVRMRFVRMGTLHIKGLTFIGCSGNKIRGVQQFVLEDSNFIGDSEQDNVTASGTPLELVETSATFIGTNFSFNSGNKLRSAPCTKHYYDFQTQVFYWGLDAKPKVGGAILTTRSNLTIVNSTFEGNSAQTGGAIYAEQQSNITIINSHFKENRVRGSIYDCHYEGGGVLYIDSNGMSTVTIESSSFEHNSGSWLGGVIALSSNAFVSISNSNFVSNRARKRGGVIDLSYSKNVHVLIFGSRFLNNSARYGATVNAVGSKAVLVDMSNSTFNNNSAIQEAGVLDISHADNIMVTIAESKFIGNRVKKDRAGVVDVTYSRNASVSIYGSELIGNKAEGGGGVMDVSYTRGMTISIDNSKFEYNIAKRYDGGAVNFWDSSNLTIIVKASNFSKNTAKSGGGAIGLGFVTNASLTIDESNFIENNAREAGALYCVCTRLVCKIAIARSVFQNNSASSGGGVLRTKNSVVKVVTSLFENNRAGTYGGAIMGTDRGEITMRDSQFYNNRAAYGGTVCAQRSIIKAFAMVSKRNLAEIDGGVFHVYQSNAEIIGGNFSHNEAEYNGGIMSATRAMVMISNATMDHNSAGSDGGIIRSQSSEVKLYSSSVSNNHAGSSGGVFSNEHCNLTISKTSFTTNRANTGGILQAELGTSMLNDSSFSNNTAHTGAVMHIVQSTVHSHASNITKNSGLISIAYLSDSTAVFSRLDFLNNVGTLLAFGSSLTIADDSNLMSNRHPTQWTNVREFFEGGTITVFQSDLIFNGSCEVRKNEAEDGGAVKAIESKIYVHGKVRIENNVASKTGGGVYLHFSELTSFKSSELNLIGNSASNKGGGVYAIGSSIRVKESSNKRKSTLHFVANRAEKGGGLYIRRNSKLYIIKSRPDFAAHNKIITFTRNSADFGGAIYASDDGMCSLFVNSSRDECFFQTLAMYSATTHTSSDSQCHNIFFFNNTAEISGHSLFGGLLDSCKVNLFAESIIKKDLVNSWTSDASVMRGHNYFRKISNIRDSDISSHPVRVCFCKDGNPDCTYQPDPLHIRKGEEKKLVLSVAIVDQIERPIRNATLYSHLGSGNDVCQNHIQKVNGNCSKVNFAIFSNNDTEELVLSIGRGPCRRSDESKARVTLEFSCLQCPIGFELDANRGGCHCICDPQLSSFFTNCSGKVLIRERNVWITTLNTSSAENTSTQYLIHPFCPLNYCHPPSARVQLNLNSPSGVDAQCADSRSGLLCGTCRPGLSLSLGSSRCLTCSSHWLALLLVILIVAFLAGILLIVSLLVLNLTVAVGTLNGIIFYANIVAANASIFLPSSCPNFITVFVSWLNLEIGFDTCFFEGMDSFWKTLIQLVFPTYVILLVVVVIVISETSSRFAKLIGKRNPVATLATLILLCYAKLLHTIIASLSFTVLHYPDGSRQTVWLPDATVPYLSGKHIALFGIAVLILMVGVAFTALLLSWQWILRLQNVKGFKWMNHQKLFHFIEPYHAPYTFKYRYWTGLLLLVRVVLYLVSAVNVEGDPRVNLVANIFVIGSLLLIKGVVQKWIYKKWPLDVLETIMYFNILALSAFTWYTLDSDRSQPAVACTSVMITFFLLMAVIFFHVYKYTPLGSAIKHSQAFEWMLASFRMKKPQVSSKGEEEPTKPTYSIVDLHHPHVIIRQVSVDEEVTY